YVSGSSGGDCRAHQPGGGGAARQPGVRSPRGDSEGGPRAGPREGGSRALPAPRSSDTTRARARLRGCDRAVACDRDLGAERRGAQLGRAKAERGLINGDAAETDAGLAILKKLGDVD